METKPARPTQDPETGRIVQPAPGTLFNSRTARLAVRKRIENTQKEARKGMLRSMQKRTPTLRTFPEAIGQAVEVLTDAAIADAPKRPKSSTDAILKLMSLTASLPKGESVLLPSTVEGGAALYLAPEAIHYLGRVLADVWADRKAVMIENTVEGEVLDG